MSNCLATCNPKLAEEWHPTKNGNLTPYDVAKNANKKVWWLCLECGHEWKSLIGNRSCLNRGCPECSKSYGEKRIKKWLNTNGIIYEPQKEFDGLFGLGNGNLSYDFYLLNYNLLIEYQGQYHDGTTVNQTKEEFEKQQEHDERKRAYAKTHNISLLEIWYWDYHNVEKILEKELNISNKIAVGN